MTHKDIYTKFMIEYDKANVTSSYPSLTEYEIATVLDKAYNALIAQKVTGNNYRRSTFESDNKSIADLEPLVRSEHWKDTQTDDRVSNSINGELPPDMLYYITAYIKQDALYKVTDESNIEVRDDYKPADGLRSRSLQIKLVSHDMASRFFSSSHNIPWIKDPVGYIENGRLHVIYDPINKPVINNTGGIVQGMVTNYGAVTPVEIVYIKQPNAFVKDLNRYTGTQGASYFDCPDDASSEFRDLYEFECNSTVAEELISLAIAFALENVESERLNSKLNMRGLEA